MTQPGWEVNASTSSMNSGRGTQLAPWKSESITRNRATLVAGVVPGAAEPDRDVHGHLAERVGAGHLGAYQLLDRVALPRRDLEHQLVVHLQKQPRPERVVAQSALHVEHRHLDDVGGAALDRCVECHPLRHLPAL